MALHGKISSKLFQRVALAFSLALAASFVSPPGTASAQDAFACIDDLTDDEVKYRIKWIEKSFDKGKKKATRSRYTWMGIFLGAAGGLTYAAIQAHDDNEPWDRFAFAYLGAGFAFSALLHAVIPAPDVWAAKRIRRMDATTPEARKIKLEYATRKIKSSAGIEGYFSGLNIALAAVHGIVGGSVKAAKWTGKTRGYTAMLFLVPPVAAALSGMTSSTQQVSDWENYRGIACSSQYYDDSQVGPDFDFSLSPGGGSFRVQF